MKKFLIFFTVSICAAATVVAYNRHNKPIFAAQYPKITQIQDNVVVKGTVVENKRVNVYLDNSAVIDQMYIKQGDSVRKGDLLFSTLSVEAESPLTIPESFLQSTISGSGISGTKVVANAGTQVVSPIDGVVMDVLFSQGDTANHFVPIVAISDLNNVRVVAPVGEELIQKFLPSMPALITVDALDNVELFGQIDTIMPYAVKSSSILGGKESSAKTDVIFAVEQGSTPIKPGYTATVKLITDIRTDTLVIPYEYILQDINNQQYVYILGQYGQVEQRYIQTGYELEDYTEVTAGLTEENVVLAPYQGIQPGDHVTVRVAHEND